MGDDVRAFCDALEIQHPIVLGILVRRQVAMSTPPVIRASRPKLVLSSTPRDSPGPLPGDVQHLGGAWGPRSGAPIF